MKSLNARHPVVRRSVAALFRELSSTNDSGTRGALDRWRSLLWKSSGVDPGADLPFHARIAAAYGILLPEAEGSGAKLLYAIQTFFAAVVKAVVRSELGGLELSDTFFHWADPVVPADLVCPAAGSDVFGGAYQQLYPAPARKALGEFYTPQRLTDLLVRRLDRPNEAVLDPTCGSGAFLLAVVRARLKRGDAPKQILREIRGFDLNPIAVFAARGNLALALKIDDESEIPVFLRDSVMEEPSAGERRRYNILGNPPWLNWDRLPAIYRDTTRRHWSNYGLFNLSGSDARHGGAKKELAQLVILRTADLYLKPRGRLAMLLPATVFQTRLAGEGFRRFRLPDDTPLGVLHVDDFSALPKSPFSNVGTKVAAILLEKGSETDYPVPFHRWTDSASFEKLCAEPVDSARSCSSWVVRSARECDRAPIGNDRSEYTAFLGANSGGANGVFWLEILGESKVSADRVRVRNLAECGKRRTPVIETEIEKDLLFPLLCWGDVDRGRIRTPSRFILLPQDIRRRTGIPESILKKEYPRTFEYLKHFEEILRQRSAFKKYKNSAPFYSMYNVGPQTVSPIKVVWRRMDSKLRAATADSMEHPILGLKPVVPQETCALIPCCSRAEAEYLVEILNGDEVDRRMRSLCVSGSKGFGTPGIVRFLGIRRFREEN